MAVVMNTPRNTSAVIAAAALVAVGTLSACSSSRAGGSSSKSSSFSSASGSYEMNPSFACSIGKGSRVLSEMQDEPRPLARPVVIAAGAREPGFAVAQTGGIFRYATTNPDDVIVVPFMAENDFESARAALIEAVVARFPNVSRGETIEVDVVGIGIGGLVARDAAIGRPGQPRLNIGTLYTISTPHKGTRVTGLPAGDARTADLRPGSAYLRNLDRNYSASDYEIIGYARLREDSMEATSAVPPNGNLWWLPAPPLEFSHVASHRDPRILADICRRIRVVSDEPAFTTVPPAPIPGGSVMATVPTSD